MPAAIVFGLSGSAAARGATLLVCSVPEFLAGVWLAGQAVQQRRLVRSFDQRTTSSIDSDPSVVDQIAVANRLDARWADAQLLLGCALGLLGAGRTGLGIELLVSRPAYPDPFYVVAHLSALPAAAGIMVMPRARVEPLQGLRTVTEGLVFASVLTIVLEVAWLEGIFGGALTRPAVTAMLITLTTSWLLGIAFAILIREPAAWIGQLGVVLALLFVADLLTWRDVWTGGDPFGWPANVLTMPVWALASWAVLSVATQTHASVAAWGNANRPRREHQRNLLFNAVILLLVVAAGIAMMRHPVFAELRILGALIAVAALVGRDLVRSQQTTTLLDRVSTQAHTDTLTGCGNRLALQERLAQLAARSNPVHLLTVDLDGFKHVNTRYGLAAGDRVLRAVADAMRERLADRGEVFRLGGDEFAVVVVSAQPDGGDTVALLIHESLGEAVSRLHDLGTMSLSASVGVDTCEHAGSNVAALQATLTRSSHAMTAAKVRGRSRTVRYDESISRALRRAASVQTRMAVALASPADGGFRVVFQPILGLRGEVLAVEALARWHDADLGDVAPDEFIPAAEAAGMIDQLGDRVLELAIADFAAWPDRSAGLTLNVSTIQLRTQAFTEHVTKLLAEHCLDPARVLLEVTESVFVQHDDPALSTLAWLAEAGFTIAVDDFGSGYSSLGYLGRLPVNVVKLDASLVRSLEEPRARAIVRSVVNLAEVLHLGVVAEGVETSEQLAATRALGITAAQGFLFGRPGALTELGAAASPSAEAALAETSSPWTDFVPAT